MIDIDDDEGAYEEIGALETTLGAILHAKKQTFMDRLTFEGSEKKIGVVIVRAEPVKETKLAASFKLQWNDVNNGSAGCLGICGSRRKTYRYTIERLIPSTSKLERFAIIKKSYPYKARSFPKPAHEIQFLTNLCNNNEETKIRFGLRWDNEDTKEINAVTTTIKELREGTRVFQGRAGASLSF